ncbi:MAG: PEP-CTERM sorting domain-containing protein, partial [Verrucomicrobiota bacterium]|nr:PEP-CTERM sorting domain-containing protein [Verrucomicrobiota bacterium]
WNSLSLIPGTTLAEGGAVSLPSSGDVQAVGVFDASDTAGMRVRVRNFTVESIPEPVTLGLFGFVGIAILFIRRRLML